MRKQDRTGAGGALWSGNSVRNASSVDVHEIGEDNMTGVHDAHDAHQALAPRVLRYGPRPGERFADEAKFGCFS